MAYSFSEGTGDGIKKAFIFSFTGPGDGYFDEDMIKVEVDGVNTLFDLTGPNQVTLGFAPPAGSKVRISRVIPLNAPYTDFERGNSFGKTNINRSFEQQLYVAHRMMDGFKEPGYYEKQDLSIGDYKLINVAPGVNPTDAVNKSQLADQDDLIQYVSNAAGSASDADASAQAAATSAGEAHSSNVFASANASSAYTAQQNAHGFATDAENSAIAAGTSEINAGTSETNAASSRADALLFRNQALIYSDDAYGHADAASTSATNAGTSETNALGYSESALTYSGQAMGYRDQASGYADNASSSATAAANSAKNWVSILNYGADPTGATNASYSLNAACSVLGSAGGTILFPPGKYLITASVNIPSNITLQGTYEYVEAGEPLDLTNMSSISIDSGATINLYSGSGLKGLFLQRRYISYPVANDSSFVGTAITIIENGCFVQDCLIVGFNTAIFGSGIERFNGQNIKGDCKNGIYLYSCSGPNNLTNVHFFPIATTTGTLSRAGTGFKLLSGGIRSRITNCRSCGYVYGFTITSTDKIVLSECHANHYGADPSTRGFYVSGAFSDISLIKCQSNSNSNGFHLIGDANSSVTLRDCDAWDNFSNGILIQGGDATILGGVLKTSPNGITANSTVSRVFIDQVKNYCTTPYNQLQIPHRLNFGLNYDVVSQRWVTQEGTWTPAVTFNGLSAGVVYESWNAGIWTKVGNVVTLMGQLAISNKGTSVGDMRVTGLPFINKTGNGSWTAVALSVDGISAAGQVQAKMPTGQSQLPITQRLDNGSVVFINNTNIAGGCNITINMTYLTE